MVGALLWTYSYADVWKNYHTGNSWIGLSFELKQEILMKMEAVVVSSFGGPEVLEFKNVEVPIPGSDDVLVKVEAVSVNTSFDIAARKGKSPFPLKPPLIFGVDPTGTITKVGDNVDKARIGERVYVTFATSCGVCNNCKSAKACSTALKIGITAPGGNAQFIRVPSFQARRVPSELDPAVATFIGRHGEAAWSQIKAANVKSGEHVLVMGASGGLGSLLVQLAKLRGAIVIAVAGSEEKLAFCRDLSVDHTINYAEDNITEKVMELTDGKGVNVVLENVSNPTTFPQALESLAYGGRLLTIGYHGGAVVPVDMRTLFRNQITISSSPIWTKDDEAFDECFKLATAGKLKATIGARFPLSDAAKAHELVEIGNIIGKVILEPN